MRATVCALLLIPCLAGCAKVPVIPGSTRSVGQVRPPTRDDPARAVDAPQMLIVRAAERYLSGPLDGWRDDCSGYVCAVLNRVGIEIEGSTASLWSLAEQAGTTHHRKLPSPGDLVFFDQTYDRNHNGRLDDELTHVGIVLTVEPDGTIVMGHGGTSSGRTTLRLNLYHPDVGATDDGRVLNEPLRRERASDPKGTRYLAGELWRGFATFGP